MAKTFRKNQVFKGKWMSDSRKKRREDCRTDRKGKRLKKKEEGQKT